MTNRLLILLILLTTVLFSCKDKDAKPVDPLANTVWQPSLIDENPTTNPPGGFFPNGENAYFEWSNCNTDDSFSFQGGKILVNNGGTVCDTDGIVSMFNNQMYNYDQENKVINLAFGTKVDVLELSDKQLKLSLNYSTSGEKVNLIFVFKKR